MTVGGRRIRSSIVPHKDVFLKGDLFTDGEDVSFIFGVNKYRDNFSIIFVKEEGKSPYLEYDYDTTYFKESDDKKIIRELNEKTKKCYEEKKRTTLKEKENAVFILLQINT